MKQTLSIITFLFLYNLVFGQDYKLQFDTYLQDSDTVKQIQVLKKWESEDPQNAELFTSYFNYYFYKSRTEAVSITNDQPEGESIEITDSVGEIAGFLGSDIRYDREELQHGLDKIDEGIKLYPNRLDMRFGKIYVLGFLEDWEDFTNEIVKTIQYSKTNNNKWTWTNNEQKEDGEDLMLSSIQGYQVTLFETQDDALLPYMQIIANEVLKLYPKSVESLSNLSVSYLITKDYDKAIEALLKAEKINPKDGIVLGNIAYGYKQKGDIAKAKKYYKKMLKLDDERTVSYAKEQLDKLGK